MKTLPFDQVLIDETRWRREFNENDLKDLADSIHRLGLFHAPVVKGDGKTLIAGERRLRAIKELASKGKSIFFNGQEIKLGRVPVVTMAEADELTYKEMELEENLKRSDLTWQEQSHAVDQLHKLRTKQKEEIGETQTKMDTAKEISSDAEDSSITMRSYHAIREDLLVSAFLDDPEVAAAPTRKEAIKILKRKLERAHKEQLAKEFDLERLNTPHEILRGNLIDVLPKIEDHKYACIIADPPYGISADKFNNQSATEHTYPDSESYSNGLVVCIAQEGLRITQFKAHFYLFCDINRFPSLKKIVEGCGWYVWNTPLIWYKGANVGVAPRPEHGPRRTYEAVLYAIKNDKRVNLIAPDVIVEPHDKSVQFGAHKPPGLYKDLIKRSCLPGDRVIDPCCGTGPIFPAAEEAQVVATGIELMEEPFGYCIARLRKMREL